MARIPIYEPGTSATAPLPGRSPERLFATPDEFGAGPGAAQIAHATNNLADTLNQVDSQNEVSDVTKRLAQARSQWTVELQNRAVTGTAGDPNFASKFDSDFGDYMSQMGGNLSTRAGQMAFERGKAELTSHFTTQASAFQIQSAGVKAKTDFLTTQNTNIDTLFRDPTQFQSVINDTDAALNDPNGPYSKMPADARAQLGLESKEQYALATARGYIKQNPQGALDAYRNGTLPGQSFLKNQSGYIVQNEAQTGIRAQEVEQMRLEAAQEKAQRKAEEATASHFVDQLVKDPTSLSATDVANSNLKPTQKLEWLGIIQRAATKDEKITTDPGLYVNTWDRLHLPDGDPNKITSPDQINGLFGKGLDMPAIKTLTGELESKKTPEGEIDSDLKNGAKKAAAHALTGSTFGMRDPNGEVQLQKFLQGFLPEYEKQKAAGTARQFTDPNNPTGFMSIVNQFKRSPQQFMKDLVEANPSAGGIAAAATQPDKTAAPAAKSGAASVELTLPHAYKSADDVVADFKAGKITRDAATATLKQNGWAE